jgi:hypothetical protein
MLRYSAVARSTGITPGSSSAKSAAFWTCVAVTTSKIAPDHAGQLVSLLVVVAPVLEQL